MSAQYVFNFYVAELNTCTLIISISNYHIISIDLSDSLYIILQQRYLVVHETSIAYFISVYDSF